MYSEREAQQLSNVLAETLFKGREDAHLAAEIVTGAIEQLIMATIVDFNQEEDSE